MPTPTMTTATEVNVYPRRGLNGRLHFQYDFKVTMPDGTIYRERRKARGATSETAARQIGLRRLHDVLRHGPNPRKTTERPPTLEEFAPVWLAAARADRQRPSTLKNKEIVLRCHLLPLLGKLRLDQIDANEIERVKEKREHMEPGSLNNLLRYIVAMLSYAKLKGYKVEIPEIEYLDSESEANWYTPEQFEELVKSAATFKLSDLVLILLAGEAGLRSGELAALRWEDVDLDKRELTVRRNLVRGHEGLPKSGKTRKVPMSPRLHKALAQHRAQEGDDGRVLQSAHGKDMTTGAQRRALQRVARYAGVPGYGIHALRHCFGARLMLNGSGAKVVMQLLGHAQLQTTERYVHASDAHCRNAVDRLAPA